VLLEAEIFSPAKLAHLAPRQTALVEPTVPVFMIRRLDAAIWPRFGRGSSAHYRRRYFATCAEGDVFYFHVDPMRIAVRVDEFIPSRPVQRDLRIAGCAG